MGLEWITDTQAWIALSFPLLIGVALIGDGLDRHIPKGYIYFAMAFSIMVELLNIRIQKSGKPASPTAEVIE